MSGVRDKPAPAPAGAFGEGRPSSPCVRTCTLDDNNVCVGCHRTLNEIIAWGTLSADEQRLVLDRLPARRA
ncbi:MAG: DUF1289 domain-containing protein [Woeseiaceae bacterium]|nr:DUF1289 domain-containing protein [Woeseiaceae bacterium]